MELKTIIWVFIAIFSVTAIITLLGITNVIKGIKENYLNKLFYTLILEVVIAVVAVFTGVDFNNQSISIEAVAKRANISKNFENHDRLADYLVEQLKSCTKIPVLKNYNVLIINQFDSIKLVNQTLVTKLNSCKLEAIQYDKSFYSKIEKLRVQIANYSGFINLKFKPAQKIEVFELLAEIFETLGHLEDGEEKNINALQERYKRFEQRHGLYKLNELAITEYETSVLIREYLNKAYPVKN